MLTVRQIIYCVAGFVFVTWSLCLWKASENNTNRKWELKEATAQIAQNKKDQQTQAKYVEIQQERDDALYQAQTKQQVITQTVYKDRIQYVEKTPNIIINVPTYWVLYLDSANGNTAMPDATTTERIIKATPTVGIDTIADTEVRNINKYYECKAKYEAWQQWYRDVQKVNK